MPASAIANQTNSTPPSMRESSPSSPSAKSGSPASDDTGRGYAPTVPFASVYPLVSARSLARPFTYDVPEEVGKGTVLSISFGSSKRRGVVVGLEAAPPDGIEAVAAGKILAELPPALVDLALWLADYYGSTPGGALELVAPRLPARRQEQPPPAHAHSLAGQAEPPEQTASQTAPDPRPA